MTNGVEEKGLGLRVQTARKSAGLTQQDLCNKADLAYSTLTKIERGAIKAPSVFTIHRIAGVLGVPLDELLGGTATPAARKHTSLSGIKFVYFDINGCLVRFFQQAFTRLAHDSGTSAEQIETTFWHYNDAVCRGEMSIYEFNTIFAKRLGLPGVDWERYYLDAVEPITAMQEFLPWAVEHYHTGLLSNIMPGFINALQTYGKIPSLPFSQIIDSSEVHAIKPEARIYEIAAQKAGVEPHEILLVDDSRTNLMAAERLGWRVLWFDDYRPENSVANIRQALEF